MVSGWHFFTHFLSVGSEIGIFRCQIWILLIIQIQRWQSVAVDRVTLEKSDVEQIHCIIVSVNDFKSPSLLSERYIFSCQSYFSFPDAKSTSCIVICIIQEDDKRNVCIRKLVRFLSQRSLINSDICINWGENDSWSNSLSSRICLFAWQTHI